jgi:hypothetical protein
MQRVQDAFAELANRDSHDESSCGSGGGTRSVSQISNADLLRYVGDMVEELQMMSDRTGCTTLTGLLALAHSEAMLQQVVKSSRSRIG